MVKYKSKKERSLDEKRLYRLSKVTRDLIVD